MSISFARTMESPCRSCENVNLNKDECGRDCDRLRAFQDAILSLDERLIKDFGVKSHLARH